MQITDKLLAILMPNESTNHKLVKFKTHAIINYTDFLRDGSPYNISENNGNWNVELLNYKIVGSISKDGVFDFDCEKYVFSFDFNVCNKMYHNYLKTLEEYNEDLIIPKYKECDFDRLRDFIYKTPQESFISLLQSKGIPVGKKLNMKLLILEKNG